MNVYGQEFKRQTVLEYDPNKGFTEKSFTFGVPTTNRPGGSGVVVMKDLPVNYEKPAPEGAA